MDTKKYKGIIVKESLEDPSILDSMFVTKTKVSESLGWHLYSVLINEEEIKELSKNIREGKWYMHFWDNKNIIAVFRNKTFDFNYDSKSTWSEVLEHGRSLGIPEEQLDFPIN